MNLNESQNLKVRLFYWLLDARVISRAVMVTESFELDINPIPSHLLKQGFFYIPQHIDML